MHKYLVTLMFVSFLLFAASPAFAVDPQCVDLGPNDPVAVLDWTDGTAAICISLDGSDGNPINDARVLTCTVEYFDASDTSMGTAVVTGGPGTYHPLTVPRDGIGRATAFCEVDGLASASAETGAIFPASSEPIPPVLLVP